MIKRICDHCQNEYQRELYAFFETPAGIFRVAIDSPCEQMNLLSWKQLDLCLACRLQIVRHGKLLETKDAN